MRIHAQNILQNHVSKDRNQHIDAVGLTCRRCVRRLGDVYSSSNSYTKK